MYKLECKLPHGEWELCYVYDGVELIECVFSTHEEATQEMQEFSAELKELRKQYKGKVIFDQHI